jgi:branched-subunit amino acid transport protein
MTLLIVLLLAACTSWVLRALLVAIVPADRVPAGLRARLEDVAPAAFAAMIVVPLSTSALAAPVPTVVAGLAAFAAAWRWRSPIAAVVGGIGGYLLAAQLLTLG